MSMILYVVFAIDEVILNNLGGLRDLPAPGLFACHQFHYDDVKVILNSFNLPILDFLGIFELFFSPWSYMGHKFSLILHLSPKYNFEFLGIRGIRVLLQEDRA